MIYLDNAATTKPSRRVMKAVRECMENEWFNPSSLYGDAVKVSQKIKRSRQIIADIVGFKPSQITFTSGSTEGNNTVINQDWDYILTSKIEHDSVHNTIPVDRKVFLKNDNKGYINEQYLEDTLHRLKGKVLVSIIAVNNETGTIQKISRIADIVHSRPDTYLHIDATQCMGKLNLRYNLSDYVVASAHKFHGIKGVGFIAHKPNLMPYIKGGHQENNLRAGTENTPGILSMAEALQECDENLLDNFQRVKSFNDIMYNSLMTLKDVRINSDPDNPYILNVSFKDVNAESLLLILSLKGIYVSSGSACNSKETKVSRILQEIGVPEDYIYGTIRISFSADNTISEIEEAADKIVECVTTLRSMKS